MAFDYSEILAVVDELLPEFGRSISILKTPRTPENSSEPWKGPATWDESNIPAGHKIPTAAIYIAADGTNLISQGSTGEFRDAMESLIRRGQSGYLVSGSVAADLRGFDRIDDGGKLYKIDAVNVLQPGPTVVLYGLEVSQ